MGGAGFQASSSGVVGVGHVRKSGSRQRNHPCFFRRRIQNRRSIGGSGSSNLPLPSSSRRYPSALNMCGALKPTTLATRPTPPVTALLLCLVSTISTRPCRCTATVNNITISSSFKSFFQIIGVILRWVLPQMDFSTWVVLH